MVMEEKSMPMVIIIKEITKRRVGLALEKVI